jgi:hypothetical protein
MTDDLPGKIKVLEQMRKNIPDVTKLLIVDFVRRLRNDTVDDGKAQAFRPSLPLIEKVKAEKLAQQSSTETSTTNHFNLLYQEALFDLHERYSTSEHQQVTGIDRGIITVFHRYKRRLRVGLVVLYLLLWWFVFREKPSHSDQSHTVSIWPVISHSLLQWLFIFLALAVTLYFFCHSFFTQSSSKNLSHNSDEEIGFDNNDLETDFRLFLRKSHKKLGVKFGFLVNDLFLLVVGILMALNFGYQCLDLSNQREYAWGPVTKGAQKTALQWTHWPLLRVSFNLLEAPNNHMLQWAFENAKKDGEYIPDEALMWEKTLPTKREELRRRAPADFILSNTAQDLLTLLTPEEANKTRDDIIEEHRGAWSWYLFWTLAIYTFLVRGGLTCWHYNRLVHEKKKLVPVFSSSLPNYYEKLVECLLVVEPPGGGPSPNEDKVKAKVKELEKQLGEVKAEQAQLRDALKEEKKETEEPTAPPDNSGIIEPLEIADEDKVEKLEKQLGEAKAERAQLRDDLAKKKKEIKELESSSNVPIIVDPIEGPEAAKPLEKTVLLVSYDVEFPGWLNAIPGAESFGDLLVSSTGIDKLMTRLKTKERGDIAGVLFLKISNGAESAKLMLIQKINKASLPGDHWSIVITGREEKIKSTGAPRETVEEEINELLDGEKRGWKKKLVALDFLEDDIFTEWDVSNETTTSKERLKAKIKTLYGNPPTSKPHDDNIVLAGKYNEAFNEVVRISTIFDKAKLTKQNELRSELDGKLRAFYSDELKSLRERPRLDELIGTITTNIPLVYTKAQDLVEAGRPVVEDIAKTTIVEAKEFNKRPLLYAVKMASKVVKRLIREGKTGSEENDDDLGQSPQVSLHQYFKEFASAIVILELQGNDPLVISTMTAQLLAPLVNKSPISTIEDVASVADQIITEIDQVKNKR